MKAFFNKIKEKMSSNSDILDASDRPDYVELSSEAALEKAKVLVRPYVLESFDDVKQILDSLREGHTIALINIRPLKEKDLVELKRAINKVKKTCDAIEGDVAGFGENWIAAVPNFGRIYRGEKPQPAQQSDSGDEQQQARVEAYDDDQK